MNRDYDFVNFSQVHELNYILRKYEKKQSEGNRQLLIRFGEECKALLKKTMITHKEFYNFLEINKKV